jgi:hypothetical protein
MDGKNEKTPEAGRKDIDGAFPGRPRRKTVDTPKSSMLRERRF